MRLQRVPFEAARWALIQARSLALRSPAFSEWMIRRIRHHPWLYLKLVAIFSTEARHHSETSLISPVMTPATKRVLMELRAELARGRLTQG